MRTSSALFGDTRDALLSTFFGKPDEAFYVNELVRTLNKGTGAVQREVKNLASRGLVVKTKRGNRCFYRANRDSNLFPEIQAIVSKSSVEKVPTVMRAALRPLKPQIATAFVFGSVAKKTAKPESDIDLLIVGDVTMKDVLARARKAETVLHREINPMLYTRDEFQARMREKNHFLSAVMAGEKNFLIGDENEVARLGH
jgi:predicted nucleotidyltransferase